MKLRHPSLARRWRAALFLLGFAAGVAAQTAQPTPYELELWRSAAQLNTSASYQAYLDAFPSGAFAAMARAALLKMGGGAATSTVPPAAPSARPAPVADLRAWTGTQESSLMPATPGERYIGPGVLEAGSIGARRQIVLPPGDWVVLAAYDGRTSNQRPITTSTLVLGRFVGAQARSLLWVHFNSRAISIPPGTTSSSQTTGLLPRWTAAERCESVGGTHVHEARTSLRGIRRCTRAASAPGEAQALVAEHPGLQTRLDAALASLGVKLATGLSERSEVQLSDTRYAYLGYVRFDCAAPDEEARCEPAAQYPRAWQEADRKRLMAFAAAVESGYLWHHDLRTLQPGSADARAMQVLGF